MMKPSKSDNLLSLEFIAAVALLLLNDFYLKENFPGFITGKLSDLAGLFSLPLFISTLFPKRKKMIYIAVGTGFIFWKLPMSDYFISSWNSWIFYSIHRVVDYSDYLALLILPLSYTLKPTIILFPKGFIKQWSRGLVLCIASFSFLATAGITGKIKAYHFSYSKNQVNQAIKTFFRNNPQCIPPEDEYTTWHYGPRDSDNELIQEINADTVSFHFFLPDKEVFYWTQFISGADDWNSAVAELGFIGYSIGRGRMRFDDPERDKKLSAESKQLREAEKQRVAAYFEKEILSEIRAILQEQNGQ